MSWRVLHAKDAMKLTSVLLGCLICIGCTTTQAQTSPLTLNSSVDEILDALDARGKNLKSFTADVKLAETSLLDGSTQTRGGNLLFQVKHNGDGRIRVNFDTLQKDEGKKPVEEKIEYLLDDGKLIDRNHKRTSQATHQVLRPGEKINLLKLGEGPFPLPIGQDKQDVKQMFDVTKIEPGSDDLPGTVHLQLVPKPDTRLARKFKSIDAWVDVTQHMPVRIATIDTPNTTEQLTDLSNVKINPELNDRDFQLEKIDLSKWNISEDAYND